MAYPSDGDPIRKRCLDALVANMAAITVANGYHHEVASSFLLEGERLVVGSVFPVVIVEPPVGGDRLAQELSCVQKQYEMDVSIFGGVRFQDGTAPEGVTEIEWLLSDIQKAVDDDSQLGGVATWTEVVDQGTFDVSQGNIAACQVDVRVAYRHLVGDPATVS